MGERRRILVASMMMMTSISVAVMVGPLPSTAPPGQGTTFVIYLPRLPEAAAELGAGLEPTPRVKHVDPAVEGRHAG
jgi:hypothetical protein